MNYSEKTEMRKLLVCETNLKGILLKVANSFVMSAPQLRMGAFLLHDVEFKSLAGCIEVRNISCQAGYDIRLVLVLLLPRDTSIGATTISTFYRGVADEF